MPLFRPTRHHNEKVGLPYALYYVTVPSIDDQGYVERLADGSFRYGATGTQYDEYGALLIHREDYFEIGRDGYYLTMAEARQAIDKDGIHGVRYVDDYNDEFQDFFVCEADGLDPEPFREAHKAEPIQ